MDNGIKPACRVISKVDRNHSSVAAARRLLSPQKRKAERFVQHLEPLQKALEVYCRRCHSDANAVEDVLQSAIGNAFRDFDLFAEGTNFRAWIFRYVNLEIKATNRTFWAKSHASLIEEPEADDDWRLNFD
ncbi:MAG: hypothetical protein HYV60_22765, partial [Planctomycetia bacterium]|nr:hypothetical protein [Planctomycetia bacterium]